MIQLNRAVDAEEETLFAEVILPLAVKGTFTYRIPRSMAEEATEGKRVSVQFGKNKVYAGIIVSLGFQPPLEYEAKSVLEILDSEPVIPVLSLIFWNWLASYYLCSLGEVMKAALPAGLKLESETKIRLSEFFNDTDLQLSSLEESVIQLLGKAGEMTISELSKEISQKSSLPIIRSLFEKNVIKIREEVNERYKVKTIVTVSLEAFYQDKENLKTLFKELEKAPRQLDLLLAFVQLNRNNAQVLKKELIERASSNDSAFSALKKKKIFTTGFLSVSRIRPSEPSKGYDILLSPSQELAKKAILDSFANHSVCLLHGITSSGKTEIYISLIQNLIEKDFQVLYLLPEIALTTQIIQRLQMQFGDRVGLYHSRMSENERVEVWQKTASAEYQVVLGARSAIFLPFKKLGMIIIDEEQETSFKQQDPAPRYHARDAAIYLASLWKIPTLLGSATPSLESYYQSELGKYGRVELFERFGGVLAPSIELIDLRIAIKRKELFGHFSLPLLEAMKEVLSRSRQAIVFQNRRGYSPIMICSVCAHVPRCINCDVSLTYHKKQHKLICHYCGFKAEPELLCPVCGNQSMEEKGFGTEKIEEEIENLLPGARIARMDLDTTRSRNSYEELLSRMEQGNIDFLVGTQMVSRGLDFANVSLTAIVAADILINYPDFRAFERSFQLLLQVSGRAGRRNERGKVIIQTYYPGHPVLQQVKQHDYKAMYASEIKERKEFNYPPYSRLIRIVLKHANFNSLTTASEVFAAYARPAFGEMAIGPQDALIPRIRNWYIKHLLLKVNTSRFSITEVKKSLYQVISTTYKDKRVKGLVIQIDVDPY